MSEIFDMLIVGYGPAGATMANLLGRRGYRVAVVEAAAAIYDKPRAITADQEAMRVFQQCGLAEQIAQATCPHPGTDFLGVDNQVIKRFYPQPGAQQLGWEPTWMFVQPALEACLREGVARYGNVQTLLEHAFVSLEQSDSEVRVQVQRLADGEMLTLRARHVIAADGARSAIRRQLDAEVEDLAFDESWIVVDAWLQGQAPMPARCVQYCRPSRPGTYIVGPGTLRRWEIKMLPGETAADFDNEAAILRVLSEFTDTRVLQLCRFAVYRFHALVARQWRFGRVFLLGDAAHQMPPFLGQGLCAAIRDTVNLAWKLDAVQRLGAAPALLDTYGEERTPHVRTIVGHAKAFGLIIGELDGDAARVRDARMRAELESGRAETVRQKFIPGLNSGLIAHDAQGRPQPGAGSLFVQPWVRRAAQSAFTRLDDLTRRGFLIASDDGDVTQWLAPSAQAFWRRIAGEWVVIAAAEPLPGDADTVDVQERDALFAHWLAALGAKAVVVRPDGYVYGAARDAPSLQRLLARLEQALFGADASCDAHPEPADALAR